MSNLYKYGSKDKYIDNGKGGKKRMKRSDHVLICDRCPGYFFEREDKHCDICDKHNIEDHCTICNKHHEYNEILVYCKKCDRCVDKQKYMHCDLCQEHTLEKGLKHCEHDGCDKHIKKKEIHCQECGGHRLKLDIHCKECNEHHIENDNHCEECGNFITTNDVECFNCRDEKWHTSIDNAPAGCIIS